MLSVKVIDCDAEERAEDKQDRDDQIMFMLNDIYNAIDALHTEIKRLSNDNNTD